MGPEGDQLSNFNADINTSANAQNKLILLLTNTDTNTRLRETPGGSGETLERLW